MLLKEILTETPHQVLQGDHNVQITTGIHYDSRDVRQGALFLALHGRRSDGHDFLHEATANGAAALIIDTPRAPLPPQGRVVRVSDTRAIAPLLASRYHHQPGQEMDMVAITGTNGKTSVAHMLESTLRTLAPQHIGVIGTSGHRVDSSPLPVKTTTPTTPEAADLQHMLRLMRDQGAQTVLMEASSLALAQHRLDHSHIDVGVFTNLTPDHLDDHGSIDAYAQAKTRLFTELAARAVTNIDDPIGRRIAALASDTLTYGIDTPHADLRAERIHTDTEGTTFTLRHHGHSHSVRIPTPGRFAVANALATIATSVALGHRADAAAEALGHLTPVPGRFESLIAPNGVRVIVDYAHSPDALDNVLTTIRGFASRRVITVFGCGGDRDPSKREPMGTIAGTYSDLCVLTTDNPRTEDPGTILDTLQTAIANTRKPYERITDRRAAIHHALNTAQAGDIVLIAGKGSETRQIFADQSLPFNDMDTVRELVGADRH